MNPMQFAIEAVGGQTAAARLCGLSNVAIHKWVKNAALPRTEYTEKTNYSQLLADASNGQFTAEWLRQAANLTELNMITCRLTGGHNQLNQRKYRKWKP
jgi:DNA-binding transcriptional regulator YdaS (Cro superfamily)